MTLRWFHCPPQTDPTDPVLDILSFVTKPPVGQVLYYRDLESGQLVKEIGNVIVRAGGRIEAWPFAGLTSRDLATLLGSAVVAFREPPSKREGWSHHQRPQGRSYWRCAVCVPVRNDDQTGALIGRAEETAEWEQLCEVLSRIESGDEGGAA